MEKKEKTKTAKACDAPEETESAKAREMQEAAMPEDGIAGSSGKAVAAGKAGRAEASENCGRAEVSDDAGEVEAAENAGDEQVLERREHRERKRDERERPEVEGILDMADGGFGFLRFNNFLTSKEDVYTVSRKKSGPGDILWSETILTAGVLTTVSVTWFPAIA